MKKLFAVSGLLLSIYSYAQPGAFIPGFGSQGIVSLPSDSYFNDFAFQSDGKIIVANNVGSPNPNYRAIGRYNTNGTLDLSFGTNGWKVVTNLHSLDDIEVQADDKILVKSHRTIYRYNSDGKSLDLTYGGGTGSFTIEVFGINIQFYDMTLDTEGRVVLAGSASYGTSPNITYTTIVARVTTAGDYDLSFNGGGVRIQVFNDGKSHSAMDVGVDGNDRIVIGVSVGSIYDNDDIIMRYNENGSLDLGFGGGDGEIDLDRDFETLAVDQSGKMLYATSDPGNAPLNPEIVLVSETGTKQGVSQMVVDVIGALVFQPDGKFIAAGYNLFGGSADGLWVQRFNANRTIDASFFSNSGMVNVSPGAELYSRNMFYRDKKLFIAGAYIDFQSFPPFTQALTSRAVLMSLDASDVRLNCSGIGSVGYNTEPGTCYATTTSRVDPQFFPSTATAPVSYQLIRNNVVVESGNGSVSGKQFPGGLTQVVYTHTDVTTHSCSFNVTVLDNQNPVANAKNVTVALDASGNATLNASAVDDGSTDNCGIKGFSVSKTAFSCSDVGQNQVVFTVTDVNNRIATTTVMVTVADNIPPVVQTQNITVSLDAGGNASILASQVNSGSTDACGISGYHLSRSSFSCSDKGSNTVVLTVTDVNNNTSSANATVTVIDEIDPVFQTITPNPATLWPADRMMKAVNISAVIQDNCPGSDFIISAVEVAAGNFENDNIGPDWEITGNHTVNLRAEIPKKGVWRVYTVHLLATDAAGNTATSSVNIQVSPGQLLTRNHQVESAEDKTPASEMVIQAYPVPSVNQFHLRIISPDNTTGITLQVTDISGRIVETRQVRAYHTIILGRDYIPGMYIINIFQGRFRKKQMVVKM